MLRNYLLAGSIGLILAGSLTAVADTIESVEKAIIEKTAKHTSFQGKTSSTQDMLAGEMKFTSKGDMAYEFMKKGDKWLYRSEGRTKSTTVMSGQEQKSDSTVLMICDGEFLYTLTDNDGQKMAMKTRAPDQNIMVTNKAYFDNLRKDFDLKLLPDETIDGKSTWVIEATNKQAKSMPAGTLTTMLNYFDKDSGLTIRTIGKDSTGKTVMTTNTTDIKINPTIAADRFVFKAPEGVQIMDVTQQASAAGEPKAASDQQTTEQQQETEKKEK